MPLVDIRLNKKGRPSAGRPDAAAAGLSSLMPLRITCRRLTEFALADMLFVKFFPARRVCYARPIELEFEVTE